MAEEKINKFAIKKVVADDTKKTAKIVEAKPEKKAKVEKVVAEKQHKAAKAPKTETASAAATFKELIIKGTMTDDQIFATVQKKHGLDDSKRSYVAWYRNNLRKKGVELPERRASK